MNHERSRSGAPIFRHEQAAAPRPSAGDPELIAAIEAHVEEHLGDPGSVLHQLVSDYVHVDVHVVSPTTARPFTTLVTSGMSERPMDDGRYAELLLGLPPSWPSVEGSAAGRAEVLWPYTLPGRHDA